MWVRASVMRSFLPVGRDLQLGREVVGVAAIERAGELDDAARRQVGHPLDPEAGGADRHLEQVGVARPEVGRRDALHRPHRPQAALAPAPRRARLSTAAGSGRIAVDSAARSMASGTSSARRTRSSRATWSWAVSPSAIISSGDGACTARASQTERTALPRRAMSSEKEVSSDSACSTRSTRGATKVPEPRRCTSRPDCTSACTALRTVTRLSPVRLAISRSGGRLCPGSRAPASIAARDAARQLQVERPAAVVGEGLRAEQRAHASPRASGSAPSSPVPRGARISPA